MVTNLLQDNLVTFFSSVDCKQYKRFCEKQLNYHIFSNKHRRLADAGLVVQRWPHQKFSYGQQYVSNIANISENLFYAFFPYHWQDVSKIEDFHGRQSHHIFFYSQ